MKENIYTIPINEAFDADCECPVCEFLKKEENKKIEYALGASMMEPDARILSNEKGYCSRHTQMMYIHGNKLSHALVLETRLKYLSDAVDELRKSVNKQPGQTLIKKKKSEDLLELQAYKNISKTSGSCIICDSLNEILKGFTSNLFHMYKKDEEFKTKFLASKGFCLGHFELLISSAPEHLNYEQCKYFIDKLCELQKIHFDRVCEDINWFTRKFDYRYKDEDWKNSKDAVQRACLKISSYIDE